MMEGIEITSITLNQHVFE